jgi:hypothetical protein
MGELLPKNTKEAAPLPRGKSMFTTEFMPVGTPENKKTN